MVGGRGAQRGDTGTVATWALAQANTPTAPTAPPVGPLGRGTPGSFGATHRESRGHCLGTVHPGKAQRPRQRTALQTRHALPTAGPPEHRKGGCESNRPAGGPAPTPGAWGPRHGGLGETGRRWQVPCPHSAAQMCGLCVTFFGRMMKAVLRAVSLCLTRTGGPRC